MIITISLSIDKPGRKKVIERSVCDWIAATAQDTFPLHLLTTNTIFRVNPTTGADDYRIEVRAVQEGRDNDPMTIGALVVEGLKTWFEEQNITSRWISLTSDSETRIRLSGWAIAK